MAGIMNKTARQYNLKCIGENGNRVVVRMAPGFNAVDDEHWSAFVRKGYIDPYVKRLEKEGYLEFGSKFDDMELERDPDTKSKSKSTPISKLKAELVKSEKELITEKLITSKHEDEAAAATIKLEAAQLELKTIKLQLTELQSKDTKAVKDTKGTVASKGK